MVDGWNALCAGRLHRSRYDTPATTHARLQNNCDNYKGEAKVMGIIEEEEQSANGRGGRWQRLRKPGWLE